MRIFVSIIALVALLGAAELSAAKPIKIGYVGGISRFCGGLVHSAIKAMKIATEEINAAGGVIGRKIEVIYRDSKTTPDEGAKQARDLIATEKIDILTGVCSSSVFMALNPIAKESKVPLISAISGTHRTTVDFGHPYVFQTNPNTLIEGNALAEYTKRKGWKRIVTMGMDYEWGRTTVKVYLKRLRELDPDVVVAKQLWPKFGETNMASFITAALAEKPDVVMAVTAGVTTAGLIKQGKTYNMFKRTNVLTFLSTESLMSLGDDMPDGVHGWARAPFYALTTPRAIAFVKKYRARHDGEYPNDWGMLGYDVMYFIRDGIKRAGSTDALKLRDAFTSMDFNSLRGKLKMRRIDNTVNSPSYIGITKNTGEYPFPIMVNVNRISSDALLPSPAEVRRMRAAAK